MDVYDICEEAIDEMLNDIGCNFRLLEDNRNLAADINESVKLNYAIAGIYKEDRAKPALDKDKGEALCIKVSIVIHIFVIIHYNYSIFLIPNSIMPISGIYNSMKKEICNKLKGCFKWRSYQLTWTPPLLLEKAI